METFDTKGYLEDIGTDFAQFLSEKNWKDCHAIIADLDDNGFVKEAAQLRQDLNKAQFEHLENEDLKDDTIMGKFAEIQKLTKELEVMTNNLHNPFHA